MTTIRYFIPEDGDEESYPNVFLAPKPRQPGTPPTLEQVKNAFPLPGTYHFRFKSPLYPGGDREKGALAVWMDVTKDHSVVPTWKNTIVAKVSRTGVEDDDEDDDADFGRSEPVAMSSPVPAPPPPSAPRAPVSHQNSMHSNTSSDHLDIFDSTAGSAPPSTGAPNLLDGHHAQPQAQAYPQSGGGGGSNLLDMNAGYGQNQAQPNAAHNDFLGMTAPSPQNYPQNGYPANTAAAPSSYGAPTASQPSYPQNTGYPKQQQQQQQQQQGPFAGMGQPW